MEIERSLKKIWSYRRIRNTHAMRHLDESEFSFVRKDIQQRAPRFLAGQSDVKSVQNTTHFFLQFQIRCFSCMRNKKSGDLNCGLTPVNGLNTTRTEDLEDIENFDLKNLELFMFHCSFTSVTWHFIIIWAYSNHGTQITKRSGSLLRFRTFSSYRKIRVIPVEGQTYTYVFLNLASVQECKCLVPRLVNKSRIIMRY